MGVHPRHRKWYNLVITNLANWMHIQVPFPRDDGLCDSEVGLFALLMGNYRNIRNIICISWGISIRWERLEGKVFDPPLSMTTFRGVQYGGLFSWWFVFAVLFLFWFLVPNFSAFQFFCFSLVLCFSAFPCWPASLRFPPFLLFCFSNSLLFCF